MIYLVYLIIPVFIILNSFKSVESSIKKSRIKHMIPSLILVLVIIGFYIYSFINKIKFVDFIERPKIFFIPIVLLVVSVISYAMGKNKERFLFMDIGGREVEEVRYRKATDNNTITINSDELDK